MLAILLLTCSIVAVSGQFDCSQLKVLPTNTRRCPPDVYLPNMFKVDWNKSTGWSKPEINKLKSLQVHPSAKALQRGLTVFNGVQVRLDPDGNVRVFKLEEFSKEFRKFGLRLGFPEVDPKDLKNCIKKLLLTEKPVFRRKCQKPFNAVVLRAVLTASAPNVDLVPPDGAALFVYNTFFNFTHPTKASRLWYDPRYNRVWPGHTTYDIKAAGNYPSTFVLVKDALKDGYENILWLYDGHEITEVDHSNIFIVLKHQGNQSFELVTPKNLVYAGKTRATVLALANEWKDVKVSVRNVTIEEIAEAADKQTLLEIFKTNVAEQAQPVSELYNRVTKQKIRVPLDKNEISKRVNKFFDDLYMTSAGVNNKWIEVV